MYCLLELDLHALLTESFVRGMGWCKVGYEHGIAHEVGSLRVGVKHRSEVR